MSGIAHLLFGEGSDNGQFGPVARFGLQLLLSAIASTCVGVYLVFVRAISRAAWTYSAGILAGVFVLDFILILPSSPMRFLLLVIHGTLLGLVALLGVRQILESE